MLIKDIMKKNPRSVIPETSLAEVMSLMRFYHCDGFPVVDDKMFVGFIQLRDVLTLFFVDGQDNTKPDSVFDARCLYDKYAPLVRATIKQFIDDKKFLFRLMHLSVRP